MGAKKGLIGGLTSTFDQVVNIVGGGEQEGDENVASGLSEKSKSPEDSKSPPEDNTEWSEEKPVAKPRPPKPPAPVIRQRSEVDANGTAKPITGNKMSRQNTAPGGAHGGAPDLLGHVEAMPRILENKPPLKRRNTNPFLDDYDPSAVEPDKPEDKATTVVDIHQTTDTASNGDEVTAVRSQQRQEQSQHSTRSGGVVPKQNTQSYSPDAVLTDLPYLQRKVIHPAKGDNDSDADSDVTEGCDEERDEEDYALEDAEYEGSNPDGAATSMSLMKSGSKNSDQSWTNEDEDHLDPQSQECVEFMKYFVQKIFDPR